MFKMNIENIYISPIIYLSEIVPLKKFLLGGRYWSNRITFWPESTETSPPSPGLRPRLMAGSVCVRTHNVILAKRVNFSRIPHPSVPQPPCVHSLCNCYTGVWLEETCVPSDSLSRRPPSTWNRFFFCFYGSILRFLVLWFFSIFQIRFWSFLSFTWVRVSWFNDFWNGAQFINNFTYRSRNPSYILTSTACQDLLPPACLPNSTSPGT